MKNKARQLKVFTADFNVALVVTLVVFFGTLAGIPPMSSIIHLGEAITDKANLTYGEPPYGHAELSPLKDFAEKVKVDLDSSLKALTNAGVVVESADRTMQEIADANGISPQKIYQLIKPVTSPEAAEAMPEEAPGGTGNRTIAQICEMYQLDVGKVVSGLKAQGVLVEADQTMKEIATANSVDPHTVYGMIYALYKSGL